MSPLINYFKGAFEELKKVTWPTRDEAVRQTIIVIAMSIGVAIFLGALDFVFTYLMNFIT